MGIIVQPDIVTHSIRVNGARLFARRSTHTRLTSVRFCSVMEGSVENIEDQWSSRCGCLLSTQNILFPLVGAKG